MVARPGRPELPVLTEKRAAVGDLWNETRSPATVRINPIGIHVMMTCVRALTIGIPLTIIITAHLKTRTRRKKMLNNIKKTLTNTILGRSVTGFAVVVVVALLFLFPMRVLFSGAALEEEASDLTITCPSSGSCSIAPSGALFNVTNMAPGDYVERSITIENARTEDSCALTMTVSNGSATPGDFPEKLFTAINDSTDDIYGEFGGNDRPTNLASLDDLFTGPISLGNLSEGQSRTYTWGVLFDTTAGNAYQNADTEFDISLGIECLDSCSTA